jgi:hypothetical protein
VNRRIIPDLKIIGPEWKFVGMEKGILKDQ